MIKAVVFDLDDTLYPEMDYVKSGFRCVSQEIEKIYGLKNAYDELIFLFGQGRSGVFDRYLQKHALPCTEEAVSELVDAYRYHKPDISLTREVKDMLTQLRDDGYKLGIITDGRPKVQRKKLEALELSHFIDKIIITEELGGIEFRKPNPKAFEIMCSEFKILYEEMVYIGDNPQKDFAVKKYFPIKTILFSSGLYQNEDFKGGIFPDEKINCISDLFKTKILGTSEK